MPAATTQIDPVQAEPAAWYTVLSDIDVTLCEGADSLRFLQGQLSCNMQKLSASLSLRGALCNLKGRVIADVRAVADGNEILLLTWHGMQGKLLSTLDKYRVFFKTTLTATDQRFTVIGLGGANCQSAAAALGTALPLQADEMITHKAVKIIALPPSSLNKQARFLCIVDTGSADAIPMLAAIHNNFVSVPESYWQLADIRDGTVHVSAEQSEVFTPQLLNYDINGVIDFKKGCYTGQEIVARMFYKAEAKRRLHYLRSNSVNQLESILKDHDAELVKQFVLADGSVESLTIVNEKSLPAVASQAFLSSFATVHSQ